MQKYINAEMQKGRQAHICISAFLHLCISAFLHFFISAFLQFTCARTQTDAPRSMIEPFMNSINPTRQAAEYVPFSSSVHNRQLPRTHTGTMTMRISRGGTTAEPQAKQSKHHGQIFAYRTIPGSQVAHAVRRNFLEDTRNERNTKPGNWCEPAHCHYARSSQNSISRHGV